MSDPRFDPPDPNGWAAQWISAFLDREGADVFKQESVSGGLEQMMVDIFDDLRQAPTPAERAFAVIEPHLGALALYKPDINPEA